MNRRNILTIVAVAAGLAVLPVAAQRVAAAHGEGRAAMHKHFFEHVASALNLTEPQKASAKQLFEQTHAQAQPLMEQMKQNRTEMEAAVKANNSGQIASVAARRGQLAGQLAELHGKALAGFYAQLTPEQKAKADEMKDHLHARMTQRFGAAGTGGQHHGLTQ
jgi:Spy/CpxP family protein refolding chaperone